MKKPISAAVIGVGAFGQNHARIISKFNDVHLIGVVDPDISRAQEIAEKFNTKYFQKYQDVAEQAESVIIVTPTSLHYEVGSFFLSHNVNVFIEKPIASNSLEADKLVKLAKEKTLTLKVGHIERFNPAFLSVRPLIRKPLFIEARRTSPFPERIKDTDVIMDMMIHDIDLILDLAGSHAKEVKAFGMKVLTDRTDMAQALIEFENGTVANITVSRVSPGKFRKIRVFEKDRYFSMDLLNKTSYISEVEIINSKKVLKTSTPEKIEVDSLQTELQDFFAAIRGEQSFGVNGEAAASALKLAEMIVDGIRCP
jgi:predicted dehydrogenase